MHGYRSAAGVCVQAPAKLNLLFEILARRSDGYHEIESLLVPLDWYDTLTLRDDPDSGEISLKCRWAWHVGKESRLPQGSGNLAFKAVELLRRRAGIERGARIELVKRIPAAAGLGGGSSDAAAALVAANLEWDLGWSHEQLAALGAELGSDVPFFLAGGPAICRGRGERVEPVAGVSPWDVVVVRPAEGLSTADVYRICRPAAQPRSTAPLVRALCRGERRGLDRLLGNRLEKAAAELSPWPGRLRQEFSRLGCAAHQMSGSGTSYFGICHSARQARHIAGRLRARGFSTVHVGKIGVRGGSSSDRCVTGLRSSSAS